VSGGSEETKGGLVLLFGSTHDALAGEAVILEGGCWCDIVERPPGTADGLCGLAVEVDAGDEAGITGLLQNAGIAFETYRRDGQDGA